ncbi:hypothetical protein BDP55DRAFT_740598 [Colletotrichum godetiae]|uniref:Legume lectin domain-containing protein n=1 Tax=Colletotrichum godetiae TaxID=1209918 RepID=A0AAJ0APN5_9PEZI|nr:uncharacterized protein BDP55DRAFT_740598 [Colletotrichum godetiae]KAK1687362.1 hypothetical protein BDP55DRAFT_740598 [Colletotrichum godetiae]
MPRGRRGLLGASFSFFLCLSLTLSFAMFLSEETKVVTNTFTLVLKYLPLGKTFGKIQRTAQSPVIAVQSPDGRFLGSTYLSGARNTRHSTVRFSFNSSTSQHKQAYRYFPAQFHQHLTFAIIDASGSSNTFLHAPLQGPSTASNLRKKLQDALHPEEIPILRRPWMEGGVGRSIGSRSCASKTSPRPITLNLVHPAPPQTASLSVPASDHRPSVAEPCTRGTTTDASWIDGYAVTQYHIAPPGFPSTCCQLSLPCERPGASTGFAAADSERDPLSRRFCGPTQIAVNVPRIHNSTNPPHIVSDTIFSSAVYGYA